MRVGGAPAGIGGETFVSFCDRRKFNFPSLGFVNAGYTILGQLSFCFAPAYKFAAWFSGLIAGGA